MLSFVRNFFGDLFVKEKIDIGSDAIKELMALKNKYFPENEYNKEIKEYIKLFASIDGIKSIEVGLRSKVEKREVDNTVVSVPILTFKIKIKCCMTVNIIVHTGINEVIKYKIFCGQNPIEGETSKIKDLIEEIKKRL